VEIHADAAREFPSLRIAQFAALVHGSLHLFTRILESTTTADIAGLLNVTAGAYWDAHYHLGDDSQKSGKKHLGTDSVRNIMINTIGPIQFLYAHHYGLRKQREQAVQLLESLPPERNHIITEWRKSGWEPVSAAHSQALLQLYHRYCTPRRCLECGIGLSIIRAAGGSGIR
jgi:hypothetical protein